VEPILTHQTFWLESTGVQLAIAATLGVFACAGVTAKVIYSGGADLDILPQLPVKARAWSSSLVRCVTHIYTSLMTPVPLHCIHLLTFPISVSLCICLPVMQGCDAVAVFSHWRAQAARLVSTGSVCIDADYQIRHTCAAVQLSTASVLL